MTAATRQSLLEVRRRGMATIVEFSLCTELVPIIDSVQTLGTLTVTSLDRGDDGRTLDESKDSCHNCLMQSDHRKQSDNFRDTKQATGWNNVDSLDSREVSLGPFNDCDVGLIKDKGIVQTVDLKNGHYLKPIIDSVESISDRCTHGSKLQERASSSIVTELPNKECAVGIRCTRKLPGRPQSSIQDANTIPNANRIHTRLSKSAREYGHCAALVDGSNACLDAVEPLWVFDEQGPEREMPKVNERNMTVRYHDFDFVKEITPLSALNDSEEKAGACESLPSVLKGYRGPSPTSTGSVNTSISSVSYKPNQALTSGPVLMSATEQRQTISYFDYIARFHTKKHANETVLCRLPGLVALDSGHVVITDINHLQVMLYGPNFHYLDSLECPSPSGITAVNQNTVAVSLFHNRKLLLLKVHTLHLERYKELHVPCPDALFDVVYRSERFYILCCHGDVHVLDDSGKQKTVISVRRQGFEARHLEVDDNHKLLFISGSDRIICLNVGGKSALNIASIHDEQFWGVTATNPSSLTSH